ncbi:alpha/beta hydrolase [Tissierella sp. MSJ-40]|uniref:Alpha/beta hydrolase n=1 Tax=Tissierella simiarum TaxID=2841534 RepID=A0ABS6E8N0_9FIRM|nr:alpha/beta hydrolase [Tissierella simiarum]MBU5439280.1 alpha/beta hydrolase [Tissierella simiarum]
MAYVHLHPIKQFDFQINRILTYGDKACNIEEIKSVVPNIKDLDSWYEEWYGLGKIAESEGRYLHAAYYYRLAEFFLKECPEKEDMYQKSIENFHKVIDLDYSMRTEYIPYQNTTMKTFIFEAENSVGNLVIFGGYDSFIEEFYLYLKELSASGYNIYLFEGPGQGSTLKNGLKFEPFWEKPTSAVLDYFGLDDVCIVGISWGGYLALRAAAFDKRISKVVAYDVLYDGFDCMTNPLPSIIKIFMKFLFALKAKNIINLIIQKFMDKKLIINWAVSHGQYITGTDNPFDFYSHLKLHTLKGITENVQCDVLLLAGEQDHYIPIKHFDILMNELSKARTLTGKIFTVEEGGAEHCQVGNHTLAFDFILKWLHELS